MIECRRVISDHVCYDWAPYQGPGQIHTFEELLKSLKETGQLENLKIAENFKNTKGNITILQYGLFWQFKLEKPLTEDELLLLEACQYTIR